MGAAKGERLARDEPAGRGRDSAAFDLYDAGRDAHVVAKVYSERLVWKMCKEVYV